MKKIVHLINSKSFLPWIKESFDDSQFENKFVLLDLKNNNIDRSEDGTRFLSIDEKGKKELLKIVNDSEITIHYFLDYTKSELILRSNNNVKHYWYFFGADIYQQLNDFRTNLYQAETSKWLRFNLMYRFRLEFRSFKYKFILRKDTPKQILLKSFKRIEKVLWYVDDEIDWINTKVQLPDFLYFKFFQSKDVIPFDSGKVNSDSKKILIGNSAAIENNHLDILKVFKSFKDDTYSVALPIVYGEPANYKTEVKKQFINHFGTRAEFLEKSIPLADYYKWLNDCPTAIMLHNRQQGLGNIFYLIANGSKLYLSENNVIYNWLKKNQITVFSFEDSFEKDYQSQRLTLDESTRISNYKRLKELLDRKSTLKQDLLSIN